MKQTNKQKQGSHYVRSFNKNSLNLENFKFFRLDQPFQLAAYCLI